MVKIKIGDRVHANVTKNGYYVSGYDGMVVGFSANGMVKVQSYKGIKVHSPANVFPIVSKSKNQKS